MQLQPGNHLLGVTINTRKLSLWVVVACTVLLSSRRGAADLTPYHLNDVQYDYPAPFPTGGNGNDFSLSNTFTFWQDPGDDSYFYMSHFFSLGNFGDPNSRLGYFGMQTTGGTDRAVIFSIWGGTSATGAGCTTFAEGGSGYHCLINYPWQATRPYTMILSRKSDAQEETFSATVTDVLSKQATSLGEIVAPRSDKLPSQSILFYEYYGNLASCQALPYLPMTFNDIAADGGRVVPTYNSKAYGYESACAANIITKICENAIDNEAGGNITRPADQTRFQEASTCRIPATSNAPMGPTQLPKPSPTPVPVPVPAPSDPNAGSPKLNGPSPVEANTPSISPDPADSVVGGITAQNTNSLRGNGAFFGQSLRPAGCATSGGSLYSGLWWIFLAHRFRRRDK